MFFLDMYFAINPIYNTALDNYAISCIVSFSFSIRQKVQINSECTESYFTCI